MLASSSQLSQKLGKIIKNQLTQQRIVGFVMVQVEEMPYREKSDSVRDLVKILEGFAPHLVKQELGEAKLAELRSLWKQESEQIPDGASDKDRYEIAYGNFMQNWVTAHTFMVKNLGEIGGRKFVEAAIDGWRKKYSANDLSLRFIGSLSRKTAFKLLAKRLAYKLQVFSPFSVIELSGNSMILKVNPCKILKTRGGGDFCTLACQNIIPAWLEKEFNVKENKTRVGNDCTVTFEPF